MGGEETVTTESEIWVCKAGVVDTVGASTAGANVARIGSK